MPQQSFPDLVRLIPVVSGPVVLMSGVGLVLLTMTNRFGRIIDRGRRVVDLMETAADPAQRELLRRQLVTLRRQAALMRVAVSLIVLAVLLIAMLILVLFVGMSRGVALVATVQVLFVSALLAMIAGLGFFLREILLSTAAHDLDLARVTDA